MLLKRFNKVQDVFFKLGVLSVGKASISNDGATIMKLLDVIHPAAKTLVEIAKSQDAEVSFVLMYALSNRIALVLHALFHYINFKLTELFSFGR